VESSIRIGKKEYLISRLKLREWLKLEDNRIRIKEAIESKDIDGFAEAVYSYISIAVGVFREELDNLSWYETINILNIAQTVNNPGYDFALLKSKTQAQTVKWDYEGRTWYIWANNLADKYGWSLEEIAELDVDDAIGLLQEIIINDQLEKEWQWALSEISYTYNSTTKKSEFRELPRPDWMKAPREEIKPVRMPKFLMPIGKVVGRDGKEDLLQ